MIQEEGEAVWPDAINCFWHLNLGTKEQNEGTRQVLPISGSSFVA